MAMSKIKGLQQWCRRITDGYAHVDVANFTTAWRDGMAFCAIIHRFRPDLIDYDSLSPDNVFENCKLAFEVAERELSIPAFLEADDMARLKVPDKLSVITYVSQYYNFLHALPQLGGPGVKGKVSAKSPAGGKRPPDINVSQAPSSKKPATDKDGKENVSTGIEKTRPGTLGDKCNICQNRVYLLERHIEAGKLYHRSCFRHSELSPTNKVYTRSPFLSPSLSKETPPLSPSSHVKTSSSNSEHQHQHRTPGSHHHNIGSTPSSKAAAGGESSKFSFPSSVASSDSPRKTDNAGSKHALAQADRDDTKKYKLQPTSASSEEQSQKANAIRDRLKNLKEKYDMAKKTDDVPLEGKKVDPKISASKEKPSHSGALPFSGKESRQLEKRREQILSAESRSEQSSRAGSRNVPLIFQKKDADSGTPSTSASNVLSNSKQSSTTTSSSTSTFHLSTPTSASSSFTSSTISNTPTSSKTSSISHTGAQQKKSGPRVVKAELVSKKEEEVSVDKKVTHNKPKSDKDQSHVKSKAALDVKDNEKGDIASLQKKFSKSEESGSAGVPSHPVARARTHKPSDASKHDKPEFATPVLRKTEGTISTTPKAAPRKSLAETVAEKRVPPERPKQAPATAFNVPKDKPPNSARSSGSGSPPPLPSTPPPPLPTSPPPSLPPSAVVNVDVSSPRSKTKSPTPVSKPSGGLSPKASSEEVSTHAPVKSRVAVSSEAIASTSNKRFSSPAIHDPPLAVLVTPQVKDKGEQQVLNGLLASLAGVRGRASSVPGIPALPFSTSSSAVSSADLTSAPTPQRSHSPTSIPANNVPSTTTRTEKAELSVSVLPKKTILDAQQDVNKTPGSAVLKDNDPHKKITNGPRPISPSGAKVPEALSVLSNLKKVGGSKSSQSTDLTKKTAVSSAKIEMNSHTTPHHTVKKNALSVSKENLNDISKSKPISADIKNQESQDRITDANFNTVKLKPVAQPDQKQNSETVSTVGFDIQLKKVNDKPDYKKTIAQHMPAAVPELLPATLGYDGPKSGGDGVTKPVDDSAQPSVIPRSSKPQNFYEEDELPDWKAALEERKKKLRDNNAKSDSPVMKVTEPKEHTAIKEKAKSEDVVALSENKKVSPRLENDRSDNKTKSPREKPVIPQLSKTPDKKPGMGLVEANGAVGNKSSINIQLKGKTKSSDWKHDAELKIAALGGFDSEEEDKQASKPKKVLPQTPGVAPVTNSESETNEGDKSKPGARKEEIEKKSKKNNEVKDKTKDSVPEFLTGISKLKPVGLTEESKALTKTKKDRPAPAPPVERKEGEDFRDRLQNLKRVQGAGENFSQNAGQTVVSKDKIKPAKPSSQPEENLPKLTKPLQLGGGRGGKNTNNNKSKEGEDPSKTAKNNSLMESINLTNTSDIFDEENKNYSPQRHSTPIIENGKTSPKAKKKKIPFFGKNKKEKIESPAESPINTKKKIEAPMNIDFDQSSEFESSLPDATARLTIEEKRTPPHRPPPPHSNQKVTSPKHISAIELQQQLLDIDNRLTDLELRGRDLEDSIRNVNVLEEDDDSLMIKWFELVSEKNDLVRQEADLVYMSREQDLESEQEHIESQLRYLMGKPDEDKSSAEMEEEDYLIQRKLELVEQRNRIVDSMDEDRLRYEEEDRDIEVTLRDKGLWKDSSGTLKAIKGKRVSNSTFYT